MEWNIPNQHYLVTRLYPSHESRDILFPCLTLNLLGAQFLAGAQRPRLRSRIVRAGSASGAREKNRMVALSDRRHLFAAASWSEMGHRVSVAAG